MNPHLLNRLLFAAFIMLQVLQLFIIPVWLLHKNLAWGWLLLLPVLLSNSWWALIHEAIHGHLMTGRTANIFAGRINAMLYGCPFLILRWGHLLHHAYSRTERERSEVYSGKGKPSFVIRFGYYFRLFGGLYGLEILAGLMLLLPRWLIVKVSERLRGKDNVVEFLFNKVLEGNALKQARLDAFLILAIYGCAFWCYGKYAWMLLLALLGRALLVSFVDNVFHYDTPLDDTRYARNLKLPVLGSALLLNFNLHGVHHLYPSLPWSKLPELHASEGCQYQGNWWSSLYSQLRGPIAENRLRNK